MKFKLVAIKEYSCPISLDIMTNPVLTTSGKTYDYESIKRHFESKQQTLRDPITNEDIIIPSLTPDLRAITKLRELGVKNIDMDRTQSLCIAHNKTVLNKIRLSNPRLDTPILSNPSPPQRQDTSQTNPTIQPITQVEIDRINAERVTQNIISSFYGLS